ncbi:MAG: hypothetical protein TR69_WS6001001058 [candidate division WS6 bacterium OLB20]|uniref:Uncharacterized protein n=1 Tax=candidate division WS6 bacterium OLB20 TaxID=1617426 RepID=A0A136LZF9_9BACT|nr:MAG: hypothetical protein TR69_WS6001001058 [candidate division WS6 bacterium OLB20]
MIKQLKKLDSNPEETIGMILSIPFWVATIPIGVVIAIVLTPLILVSEIDGIVYRRNAALVDKLVDQVLDGKEIRSGVLYHARLVSEHGQKTIHIIPFRILPYHISVRIP